MLLDDVYAGDELGNRMLNLNACVHLDKEEFAVFVQEFKRTCATIADAFTSVGTGFADFGAFFFSDERGRCFFDDFLVAALHGAVALGEVDGVAVFVGNHLDFDVARTLQIAFHVNHRVAECCACFGFGHFDRLEEVFFFLDDAHTATAAAAGGFDNDGITDFIGDFEDFFAVVWQCAFRAGNTRHAGFDHGVFGGYFVAHQTDGVGFRADEDKAGLFDLFGKIGVFGEEAVARVDAVGFGDFGSSNEGGNVEVALCGCGRADAHGFVSEFDVQAVFVGFRMDGDGGDAHFTAGTQDAQGDFAPVGDQYFFQHDNLSGWFRRPQRPPNALRIFWSVLYWLKA